MRKVAFLTAVLSLFLLCLSLLCACDVEEMGTLPDLSRPYTGLYECENISLGGKEYTDRFEELNLELNYDGTFLLSYRTDDGAEGEYGGTYRMNVQKEEITLTVKQRAADKSFTFPYEEGAIVIDYNLFGTLLHAEFKMP